MASRPHTKNMMTRRQKFVAFAPALVVLGVTALAASGLSLVGGATAASTVNVTGTVASTFSTDPGLTGCADETLVGFASVFAVSNGCQISFTSNNANGTEIVFKNNTAAEPAFFCSDPDGVGALPRTCATNSARLEDAVGSGQTIANGSDKFGIALKAVAGAGPTLSTVGGSGVAAADATPTGPEADWSGIPTSAGSAQLCKLAEPNATLSTCDFAFGGSGSGGTQGAGDYSGVLNLTAQLL